MLAGPQVGPPWGTLELNGGDGFSDKPQVSTGDVICDFGSGSTDSLVSTAGGLFAVLVV